MQGLSLIGCHSVSEATEDYDEYGFYINNTTYEVAMVGCRSAASGTGDYLVTDYSKIRSSSDIGTNQPLNSGFIAEGNITMNNKAIETAKSFSYNSWGAVTTITTGTLDASASSLVALNTSGTETVTDITSDLNGIPILVIRNAGSSDVTFTHNNSKLRNNSGADIVLSAGQSISYAYVSGTVWQQV